MLPRKTKVDGKGQLGPKEVKRIMIKTMTLSMCLAASSLALNAHAQDVRHYADGPVTEYDYVRVEYGHFEEYVDWPPRTQQGV